MGCWMFPALSLTRLAEIFLLPVGRTTIAHQRITPAVGTMNRHRYHVIFHLSNDSCAYSLTSFPFWPLPAMEVKVQVTSYQDGNYPLFGFALRGSTVSGNWQGYEAGIGYLDAQNHGSLCNARIITTH